jgi:quercetin dioxygenase-like cupin family protein
MRARRLCTMRTKRRSQYLKIVMVSLVSSFLCCTVVAQQSPSQIQSSIQSQTLNQGTSAWDGTPYTKYPGGQPELSVLKITIPPHTVMKWHTHAVPNAGYVLSGSITVETTGGAKRHFVAGQAIAETVDLGHRGMTGDEAAVLIVFYAGAAGVPLSIPFAPGR